MTECGNLRRHGVFLPTTWWAILALSLVLSNQHRAVRAPVDGKLVRANQLLLLLLLRP